jgi:segregation and condensation protein A
MSIVATPETYRIELPIFEGPFDLLLFFIERDELDIEDIPIAKITRDFLDYIHQLEAMDMELASEFIFVAGSLMKIKSKMLIPRPVVNEKGEVEDPRRELVNRLLEYKRFKDVQDALAEIETEANERSKRLFVKEEEKIVLASAAPEDELLGIDLYAIMRTYRRLMDRHQERISRPSHVIRAYPYTVDQIKERLLSRLVEKPRIDFVSFVLDEPNNIFCVFTFLSVLELAQQGQLSLVLGKGFNNFWICRPELQQAG